MQHRKVRLQLVSVLVILSMILSACVAVTPAPAAIDSTGPLRVVATYSVLGELVQQIAGDAVELTVLVGPDGDPHVFEPTPQDAAAIAGADILFENGFEFETWLDDLFTASGAGAARVAVSDGVDALSFDGHAHEDEHADHDHAEEEHADVAPKRLAIADGAAPVVHLFDVAAGEALAHFDVAGPARVYAGADGTLAYALQGDANRVNVIDTGVRFVPHDDHFDLELTDPALLDFALDGTSPIHFVAHDGLLAIFDDGDGTAAIFDEEAVRSGGDVTRVDSGRPHHGVAVPMDDVVVISTPNPDDPEAVLPVGVTVRTLQGEEVASFAECPGLHGETNIGHDAVAFGCTDGVLVVERTGDAWNSRKLANPAENPNNARVGTLHYAAETGLLAGNFGREGLVLVDLEAGALTPVLLPSPLWAFALSEHDPHQVLALTIDGNLHAVDGETGELLGSVAVVDAFELPKQGEHGALRPALLASGDMAYISSPATGEVVEVHLAEMAVERRFIVEGVPFALAAFGAMADPHAGEHAGEHAEDHAHAEGDDHAGDHDHAHGEFDPHTWLSPRNAIVMVENIRAALAAADPANAAQFDANAAAYTAQLEQLDAEIRAALETLPAGRRKLVTTHDLFGYFARDYGFEVLGSALGSVTTEAADPSAGQIAELVEEIRAAGVPAIFVETVGNPALMEQIAQEAGVTLAPPLHTHGLGPAGSGAETYIGMIRTNVQTIVEALR